MAPRLGTKGLEAPAVNLVARGMGAWLWLLRWLWLLMRKMQRRWLLVWRVHRLSLFSKFAAVLVVVEVLGVLVPLWCSRRPRVVRWDWVPQQQ